MKRPSVRSGAIEQDVFDQARTPTPANSEVARLVSRLQDELPSLLAEEPVQLACLYGSTVSGRTTPFSDLDMALVLGTPIRPLTP